MSEELPDFICFNVAGWGSFQRMILVFVLYAYWCRFEINVVEHIRNNFFRTAFSRISTDETDAKTHR